MSVIVSEKAFLSALVGTDAEYPVLIPRTGQPAKKTLLAICSDGVLTWSYWTANSNNSTESGKETYGPILKSTTENRYDIPWFMSEPFSLNVVNGAIIVSGDSVVPVSQKPGLYRGSGKCTGYTMEQFVSRLPSDYNKITAVDPVATTAPVPLPYPTSMKSLSSVKESGSLTKFLVCLFVVIFLLIVDAFDLLFRFVMSFE